MTKTLMVLVTVAMLAGLPAAAVDVSGQWEILGAVTQDAADDSWQDSYGLGVSLNVGWLRVGATLSNEDDPTINPEVGWLLRPEARTFGYLGAGVERGDLFYRVGAYRRLFVRDETCFVLGGGIRYLDREATESDLQPWLSVGWVGR